MRIVGIIAMLLVALLLPAVAFAAYQDIPTLHDIVRAEFQPGINVVKITLDNGESTSFTARYAPELRGDRMYVSLDAVCQVLDCLIGFDYDRNELVVSALPEISVPVDRDTLEKVAQGKDVCIMLPLRKTFEEQGWKVDWQGDRAVIYR